MARRGVKMIKWLAERIGWRVVRVHRDLLLLHNSVTSRHRIGSLGDWLAIEHLVDLWRALGVECVLDVGANDGGFVAAIRAAGFRGRIVSFEPQASCQETLRRRFAADPHWALAPYALGSRDEETTITLRSSSLFTSLRQPRSREASIFRGANPEIDEALAPIGVQPVHVRRLDGLRVELGLPDANIFLKIDTQGHDEAVLEGAARLLPAVVGIQVELTQDQLYDGTSDYLTVIAELRRLGFGINAMVPVGTDRASQATIEFDGVFVRMAQTGGAPRR